MSLSTPRLDDDDQRLAALWDGAPEAEEGDDGIDALFSSSHDDAEQKIPRAATRMRRRYSFHREGRPSRSRPRPLRAPQSPWLLGAAAAVAAAGALILVAPRPFDSPHTPTTDRRQPSGRTVPAARAPERRLHPKRPGRGSRETRERRQEPVESPHQREHVRRDPAQAPRDGRRSTARPASPRHVAPAVDPPPRPHKPHIAPPALSSACNEFPPC